MSWVSCVLCVGVRGAANNENRDGRHGVSGRQEGAKHDALDKVQGRKVCGLVDAVDGHAHDDRRHKGPDDRVCGNAPDVAHEVALLEREARVEDDGREQDFVEHFAEGVGGEQLQQL